MINLDFTTDNPRWGESGIRFTEVCEYAKTLGFLSNIRHYRGYGNHQTDFDDSIIICIEKNHADGAWAKECRIHSYKDLALFTQSLPSLARASSAGRNDIVFRVNSNKFINHLIAEYDFSTKDSGYVSEVSPSDCVKDIFEQKLQGCYSQEELSQILCAFRSGFNL